MKSKNKLFIFMIILLLTPIIVNATAEKYEANMPPQGNSVRGDTDHLLFYQYFDGSVYEYNIKNNTYEQIITTEKRGFTSYALGNYIYIWHDTYNWDYPFNNPPEEEMDDDITEISCYNLTTHKLEFNYRIEVGAPFINDTMFVANHKQDVVLMTKSGYKLDNGTQFRYVYQFDKTGKQIGLSHYIELTGDHATSLDIFTPNDEFLLLTNGYTSSAFHYIENGVITGNTYNIRGRNKAQTWRFISDDIAVGAEGQIARFTKETVTDSITHEKDIIITYEQLNNVYDGNFHFDPALYNDTNSVFVPNGQGAIIEYDKKTYQRIGYINIEEKAKIVQIAKDDKYFYVLYYLPSNKDYVKKIPISELELQKQITIDKHTALTHSLNEIKAKYQASKSIFDYTQSIYKESPDYNAPYSEGSLKDEVINDTLNQLNFYRWLSGMNTLELNKDKMARSQKGAFIQDLTKYLTHYPKKPAGMSNDFYNEAKKGTGASIRQGDTYSGNVSYNTRIDKNPLGYIDDSANVSYGVGHRSSMLDPYAYAVSFGQSGRYNATSIYYDNTNNNPDDYYSYPTPGYFPYDGLTSSAYWSTWISKEYQVTPNTTVTLTHNNKKYTIDSNKLYYDPDYRTIYYKVPDELKNLITKNNKYVKNETVNVNINNLEERYTATYATINYNTIFVDLEEEMEYIQGDLNNNGKIDLTDVLIELKIYFKNITPTSYQSKVGDMNNRDGINLTDILMLLKLYFAK